VIGRETPQGSAGGRLVEQYIKELTRTARALPPTRRTELLQDVRSHIDVALDERGNQEPETVRSVLDGLGKPADIVAAALTDDGVQVQPADPSLGGREVVAILLLLFGALAVGFGWLAGVLLLWASPRWTVREKVVGTLVLPGGVVLPIILATEVASGTGSAGGGLVAILLVVVGVAAPVLSAMWLARQARTATVLSNAPRWATGLVAVGVVVLALPFVGFVFFSATSTGQGVSTPVKVSSDTVATPTQSAS
jgi:uncharacterized membrane protein